MGGVIRDSNMLEIPEQIATELGLHSGVPVDVTRITHGFEVKLAGAELRRSADGVWRSHAEKIAILNSLKGIGRVIASLGGQVEALLQGRACDVTLDQSDGIERDTCSTLRLC